MTLVYIAIAAAIGTGSATQLAMLSSVGRERGAVEAAWISILGTVAGAAVFLAVRSLRADSGLPPPFDRPALFVAVALVAFAAALGSARGLEPYFAGMGLLGLAVIAGAAFIGPRIGIALYVSSLIAAQMIMSTYLDHVGAFGVEPQRMTLLRGLGVIALIAGVALVRQTR